MRYLVLTTVLSTAFLLPLLFDDIAREYCDWQLATQRIGSCVMSGTGTWKYAQVSREALEATATKQRLAHRVVMPRLERRGRNLDPHTYLLYAGALQHFAEPERNDIASR
jgi:hypothetical protein